MKLRVHTKPTVAFPNGRFATISFAGPGTVTPGATETLLKDESSNIEYRFDTATGHLTGWGVFGKTAAQFKSDLDASITLENLP